MSEEIGNLTHTASIDWCSSTSSAVLLCDTSICHCFEEDLPSTTVTVSLTPLVQAILDCLFLIKGVASVAGLSSKHSRIALPLFACTLFADVLSEEDSEPLASCNGVKWWDTSELMLQLTVLTAAAEVPCNASHEQNTSAHAHSQCTGWSTGSGTDQEWDTWFSVSICAINFKQNPNCSSPETWFACL